MQSYLWRGTAGKDRNARDLEAEGGLPNATPPPSEWLFIKTGSSMGYQSSLLFVEVIFIYIYVR